MNRLAGSKPKVGARLTMIANVYSDNDGGLLSKQYIKRFHNIFLVELTVGILE